MYEGDDPHTDGISMVWPEFVDSDSVALPEGEVPNTGHALMFVVNPERIQFHKERIRVGTRGFFMEGARRVAECEVTRVLDLHQD